MELKTIVRGCLFTIVLVLHAACGSGTRELTPQEQALLTAKESYEALYSGQIESFLDSRAVADLIDAEYREMLYSAYRLHATQVNDTHHGVDSIVGTRAVMDSTLNVMQTFLTLYFIDGTSEEIVVPMVKQGDRWMLK